MTLSAPIYRLRRAARALARERGIALHRALDHVAKGEGFRSWALLVERWKSTAPAKRVFATLAAGDMLLVAARPGHGKTLLALELAVEAMRAGHRSIFFSLDWTEVDLLRAFAAIGVDPVAFESRFHFDASDAICARYIARALGRVAPHTLVVVDYLQLLDQRRDNDHLADQVDELRDLARERGLILVFVAQVDRAFDLSLESCPTPDDVRLPNPVDLGAFNRRCFLGDGQCRLESAP